MPNARVAELVDARDLKSLGPKGCASSILAPGTIPANQTRSIPLPGPRRIQYPAALTSLYQLSLIWHQNAVIKHNYNLIMHKLIDKILKKVYISRIYECFTYHELLNSCTTIAVPVFSKTLAATRMWKRILLGMRKQPKEVPVELQVILKLFPLMVAVFLGFAVVGLFLVKAFRS